MLSASRHTEVTPLSHQNHSTTMSEKVSTDNHNSEDEKYSEPDLADAAARRQSVALNIVENPLKVRHSGVSAIVSVDAEVFSLL